MSSDQMFGMNARPRDRVDFRKVTTCAPIEVDNFSQIEESSSQLTNYTAQSDLPELQYVKLYYGESVYMSTNGTKTLNYNYRCHTFLLSFDNLEGGNFNDYFEYCLDWSSWKNASSSNRFTPITQLTPNDADITLAFLSANLVVFNTPVDDSWFSAHLNATQVTVDGDAYTGNTEGPETSTIYFRDRPVNILGYAEGCSLLVGIESMADAVSDLQLNDAQAAAADVLIYASSSTGI
ncbi:hypothetical protein OEA41_002099 [Lepraria neglecta]|uniref:Uncharacterized protein n=1 Tax=Lepraria neglecta TaxID=209136 RepID=A0AAD9ZEA0_9LECA|nr:hypothetical protein OEA41_002099 [Lepraria neglecta]